MTKPKTLDQLRAEKERSDETFSVGQFSSADWE